MTTNIHWLGHSSFRIDAGEVLIYIDPWQIGDQPKADLILITHEHRDHCSPADVQKLRKDDTVIAAIGAAAAKLPGPVQIVKPGDKLSLKEIPVEVVPAYNTNKFRSPGVAFHPRDKGNAGFIVTVDGQRIYHAGDTDEIPEMGTFGVDIALLPMSGTYVMTAEEAANAANILKPRLAIPMHVGRGIGALDDMQEFKNTTGVAVEILPMEE